MECTSWRTPNFITPTRSMVAKREDQIALNCSGPAAMAVPWSVGSVASKTETKHPQPHYYRNLIFRMLRWPFALFDSDGMAIYSGPRPVSNLSQTSQFPALESKEGLGRHGLNESRLMSMSVAWLALTYWTEMYGKPVVAANPIKWDTHSRLF